MIGDGVNDVFVLVQVDVGIVIGFGIDVVVEIVDIVLVDSDFKDIVMLIFFGKVIYCKMVQNLGWVMGYNLIVLFLVIGFVLGLIISLVFGVVFMSISIIICVLNV